MKLYFIRHGKYVTENSKYRTSLSQDGISEIKNLVIKNALPNPYKIYSSHFIRAQESAQIISKHFGIPITIKKCLGEWKIQELDLPFSEFLEEEKRARKDMNLVVSGGESLVMAQKRIYNCVLEICKDTLNNNKKIIIVSHGNVLYLLFKKLLNQHPTFDEKHEEIKTGGYGVVECNNSKLNVIKKIITQP